jgi:hypothetical protein
VGIRKQGAFQHVPIGKAENAAVPIVRIGSDDQVSRMRTLANINLYERAVKELVIDGTATDILSSKYGWRRFDGIRTTPPLLL